MTLLKKFSAYIKITRPLNTAITFCVVVVAILISQKYPTKISLILLASLTAALTAAAGNVINDLFDIETDKTAHPDRVLTKGTLTKTEAKSEYFLLNSIAAIIAVSLSTTPFVIVLLSISLLYIYSAYLKRIILVGNITVAALAGLAFIYGGVVTNNPKAAVIPAFFAFFINLIREIVKDIQDIDGDKKQKIITFPVRYGIQPAKKSAAILIIILIAFTFYPFIFQVYKIEFFVIVMIFVNPVFIICVKNLLQKKAADIALTCNLLKLNMIIGLIAIYLGN
ncbi:MAG: geranylgeranylglycerol-phosphate geranylgeranyltransferase [Ignavibacteriales bacterium]|jgi:geranylgeranylglycerol-phosphate geranylgeranyltransferase|nr:geranylgeranylglycerol-phosphate geranylgeranyltransferase [Ignavibacteriaceae bacterium]MEB2355195.1 geranylgeranylglycerol-phosphate geranylgeranyltransferase [Ignavibacteriales bacterium]